jgi:O-antigen ligase
MFLAAALAGSYMLRASLVGHEMSGRFENVFSQATIVSLLVAFAYVTLHGLVSIHGGSALLVVATGISLAGCEGLDFALPRWIGWAILVWTLGPINCTPCARKLRCLTLEMVTAIFAYATALSAVWWIAGMPNMGRGDFTGVLWHSMTLGPVAALAALLAFLRALSLGSLLWYALFVLDAAVCLLASSRSALAALVAGLLIVAALKLKRSPLISSLVLGCAATLIAFPTVMLDAASAVVPDQLTAGLEQKSWENSRERHWDARWEEFCSSPWTGIGFSYAWEDSAGVDEESGSVETGSSYLAILSMTGCCGAAAWLVFAAGLARRLRRKWTALAEEQRFRICAMAGFWAVHLGAEGYIYAVGSTMGMTFWLWLGTVGDELS